MCFNSSSDSSSSNTQSSEQTDERIAASDGGIAFRLDDGSSIELTDPGLIEAAGAAFESFEAVNSAALDFASSSNARSFELADEVLASSRTEQSQALEQVLKIGAVVAVVAIVASQAPRFLKG